MSRPLVSLWYVRGGFPRVSGDEPPNSRMCYFEWRFSPRERG